MGAVGRSNGYPRYRIADFPPAGVCLRTLTVLNCTVRMCRGSQGLGYFHHAIKDTYELC